MASAVPPDAGVNHGESEEQELELYTIPIHSNWFSWDEIHETERLALGEFFDGSSISRNPRIYKEYRDFMINRYREDPSRRLKFTEVRKSLVGDISLLRKIFLFLEKWGIINFSAPPVDTDDVIGDDEWSSRVRVEEGAPSGIRVVAVPNSSKLVTVPTCTDNDSSSNGSRIGLGLPPLTSFSDVFGDLVKQNGTTCTNCGKTCEDGFHEYTKGEHTICVSCFKGGHLGEGRSSDDFKYNEGKGTSDIGGAVWTEAEVLLLLESVPNHGDDWELVAQNVKTKSKLDCILKLIELPFGEFMLGYTSRITKAGSDNNTSTTSQMLQPPFVPGSAEPKQQSNENSGNLEQNENENEDAVNGPSPKRLRVGYIPDSSRSLMNQVALISSIVGPSIAASAADSAVSAICDETLCSREIFTSQEGPTKHGTTNSDGQIVDTEMDTDVTPASDNQGIALEENFLPLRARAATATALGAAAAHAKLLAEQEEKELKHLMADIIEAQMKKVQDKIKHFKELESLMEKEHARMDKLKEAIVSERIDVLRKAVSAGLSRWRDHVSW
ncbi:hypothetical protein MLD38_032445 [Melastoma candidum]|uniref:Uncharacterized protein n=1 Tax=Melastoma candidum TaxID=119954 RepID=A0ACB9M5G2_9MYRT|nr:hypothetical protein MLD38_032445 [Melastoma candidum]